MFADLFTRGALFDVPTQKLYEGPELAAEARRRADRLAAQGIGAGAIVAILHGGSASFFCDLLAVWRRGACAACLSPELTPDQVNRVVDFLGAGCALVEGEKPAGLVPGIEVLALASDNAAGGTSPDIDIPADLPALILFTSGTTGDPKGVVHTFASLAARIDNNLRNIPTAAMQRTLCALPTHFGHGLIGNCLTPLAAGGRVHLLGKRLSRATMEAGALVDAHDIGFMSSVPTFWKVALKMSKPPAAGTLQRVHVGSAPLSAELWRAIREWSGTEAVVNMYGITETANWIAGADPRELAIEDGLVGRMWGGEAAVIGEDGVRRSEGTGEIAVRPPSLMAGYFHRPDLTAQAIVDGWYRTGDTGTIDAQGVIRLSGRRKDEINRGGMKVQPAEIDLLLERHPDIAEACCFGIPDDILGEQVGVAVRLLPGRPLDVTALRHWCRERLHAAAVPERWFAVDEIPKTDRGKIRRDAVMSFCLAREKK